MRRLLAVIACLFAAAPAAAQSLDTGQVLGNEEGCEQLRAGHSISDHWFLLRPDSPEGAIVACTFTEVSRAADGTDVVTGLCSNEGEEDLQARRFVVAPDPEDGKARLVFEDGDLWDRFAACE